ncbi:MAG: hypothetical protein IJ637_04630, partial [Prevotella sp.]|nr:hypothetical protein [Prevotella sp.]
MTNKNSIPCICLAACLSLLLLSACSSDIFDHSDSISAGGVSIALSGVDSGKDSLEVQLRNLQTNSIFTALTDSLGIATFSVTPGNYEASVSVRRSIDGFTYMYNGSSGQITVLKYQM